MTSFLIGLLVGSLLTSTPFLVLNRFVRARGPRAERRARNARRPATE